MDWHDRYLKRFYYGKTGWTDGTSEFHRLCSRHAPPGARLLEFGPGPTNPTSDFLSTICIEHDGVDVSEEAEHNRALHKAFVSDIGTVPAPDCSYHMAISSYVVEHVEDPGLHLREVHRVLVPGGCYIFRTPNLYHYVALFSSLTPDFVHKKIANRLRRLPEGTHEPWPTVYAMNTEKAVVGHARAAGFSVAELTLVEKEPSYCAFARPAFLLGLGYERLVNSAEVFRNMRANLFVVLVKE